MGLQSSSSKNQGIQVSYNTCQGLGFQKGSGFHFLKLFNFHHWPTVPGWAGFFGLVWFGFYFSLSTSIKAVVLKTHSCSSKALALPSPNCFSAGRGVGWGWRVVECTSLTQVSCLITLQSDFPRRPLAWQDALFEVISLHSRESTSSKTPFPSNPCCALVHQRVAGREGGCRRARKCIRSAVLSSGPEPRCL